MTLRDELTIEEIERRNAETKRKRVLGRGVRDLASCGILPSTPSPHHIESRIESDIYGNQADSSHSKTFSENKPYPTRKNEKRVESPVTPKFKNVHKVVDGHSFDSTKEANRYRELKLMEHAGVISNLEIQKPFVFVHNEIKLGKYVADFVYQQDGKTVVEDVKGYRNPKAPMYQIFKMKVRMMKAFYGLDVTEI